MHVSIPTKNPVPTTETQPKYHGQKLSSGQLAALAKVKNNEAKSSPKTSHQQELESSFSKKNAFGQQNRRALYTHQSYPQISHNSSTAFHNSQTSLVKSGNGPHTSCNDEVQNQTDFPLKLVSQSPEPAVPDLRSPQAKALNKSLNYILEFRLQTFVKNGRDNILVGQLYHQEMGDQSIWARLRVSSETLYQLGAKPGGTLSRDQLQQTFGDRLPFIEITRGDSFVSFTQVSCPSGSGQVLKTPLVGQFLEEGFLALRENQTEREINFEKESEDVLLKATVDQAPFPRIMFFPILRELVNDLKNLSSQVLYFGMGSAALGAFIFLFLKLSE